MPTQSSIVSSLISVTVIFVILMVIRVNADFKCQQVIDTYNQHVNVGNFSGAAALTFTDTVRYIIPGKKPFCPYCDTYEGKERVISLFLDGFLGHFYILNPLYNIRQISTNDKGGPNGNEPELVDFNDEAFMFKSQFNGKYFRVPVIHNFIFDRNSCLIRQMILFHDPYIAASAFAGFTPAQVPIMPTLSLTPPSSQFSMTSLPNNQVLLNWQVIRGEDTIDETESLNFVRNYYKSAGSSSILSISQISQFFMGLNYAIPHTYSSILVPGDSRVLPYAGIFLDIESIQSYFIKKSTSAVEENPLLNEATSGFRTIVVGGSVIVFYKLKGYSIATGTKFENDAVDYFQLAKMTDGSLKIVRLTRFFDTWDVTTAALGSTNSPFPQFIKNYPNIMEGYILQHLTLYITVITLLSVIVVMFSVWCEVSCRCKNRKSKDSVSHQLTDTNYSKF